MQNLIVLNAWGANKQEKNACLVNVKTSEFYNKKIFFQKVTVVVQYRQCPIYSDF